MTIETRAAFARRLEMNKSTVTRLAQAGRIVVTEEGMVEVEKSLALIQQTKGTRDDVAARHAAQRLAEGAAHHRQEENSPEALQPVATPPATPPATPGQAAQQSIELNEAARRKALAESRRVMALADKEEMERDRIAGNLIPREDVDAAMKFIGATIRSLMDVLPDQVAPLVAPVSDLAEVHQHLSDAARNVLISLGEAIRRQQDKLAGEGA